MKIKHALVGAAVVGMTALAGPALASGNAYTVAVGGSTANTSYALSAASTGTLQFVAERNAPFTTNLNMNCSSGNLTGTGSTVNGGTSGGGAPTAIANLPAFNFLGCTGPGGALTVTTNTPMVLHGTSAATTAATDVVQGHIEGLNVTVSNAVCNFTVTGSADGSFNEATQQLTVNETGDGSLTYTLNSGCLGQLPGSGEARFTGTFNVTTAGGAINLR